MKQIRIDSKFLLSILLICFLSSCTNLSAGKKYTLAKVDRENLLIEPHKRLKAVIPEDSLDKINPTKAIRIALNAGCLPYLQEVGRPEVAIFVSTKIRKKNKPNEELLWEKVYLNSEDPDGYTILNKDSCFAKKDITILPPIIYDNQDISVSIRIIEIDSADNERMNALVSTAASVAATFQPQYAGAISIFQNTLNLIIANNADDIEFQYDFTLSTTKNPVLFHGTEYHDLILNPRIGTYAIIKTEHRERQIIPFGYAEIAESGIRYGTAEILKLATLGIMNWPVWCNLSTPTIGDTPPNKSWLCNYMDLTDQDDLYHTILGRPFAPQRDAFLPPTFIRGVLSAQGDFEGNLMFNGDRIEISQKEKPANFKDQAYILLSVVDTDSGLSVDAVQTIATQKNLIEKLKLNTAQLSPTALQNHLKPIEDSTQIYISKKQIRENCIEHINTSKTQEQVLAVQKDCEKQIADLKNKFPNAGSIMNNDLDNSLRDINSLATQHSTGLPSSILIKATSKSDDTTDITLNVTYSSEAYANAPLLKFSGIYWAEGNIRANNPFKDMGKFTTIESNFGRKGYVELKNLIAGSYEVEISINTTPTTTQRYKFSTPLTP